MSAMGTRGSLGASPVRARNMGVSTGGFDLGAAALAFGGASDAVSRFGGGIA
jgi:hypothetical protein